MNASYVLPESGRYFIEYQDCSLPPCNALHVLQKILLRLFMTIRLHHNNADGVLLHDFLQFLDVVITKRNGGIEKSARYTTGLETGKKKPVEIFVRREISRQIPIMPTVISAKSDFLFACRSPGNSYRYRHGFSASASISDHVRTWM